MQLGQDVAADQRRKDHHADEQVRGLPFRPQRAGELIVLGRSLVAKHANLFVQRGLAGEAAVIRVVDWERIAGVAGSVGAQQHPILIIANGDFEQTARDRHDRAQPVGQVGVAEQRLRDGDGRMQVQAPGHAVGCQALHEVGPLQPELKLFLDFGFQVVD